jgi:hypothetical protein
MFDQFPFPGIGNVDQSVVSMDDGRKLNWKDIIQKKTSWEFPEARSIKTIFLFLKPEIYLQTI